MSDNPFAGPEELPHSGKSIIGMIIKVAFGLVVVMLIAVFFLPTTRNAREAARRSQCKNNLKQIALALHSYHDNYGAFPPAFTVDEAGQPLHSWRTLILPFVEQQALYELIDLSKPWNDPANSKAFEARVSVFCCPSTQLENNETTYFGVSGEHSVFFGNQSRQLADIKDGASDTLMVVEMPPESAIPWMMPQDAGLAAIQKIRASEKLAHSEGFNFVRCDGSAQFLSSQVDDTVLQALVTIDGGETVGEY